MGLENNDRSRKRKQALTAAMRLLEQTPLGAMMVRGTMHRRVSFGLLNNGANGMNLTAPGYKVERLDATELDVGLKPHLLEHASTRNARDSRVVHEEELKKTRMRVRGGYIMMTSASTTR